jgi:nitrite reductase/ring-hydroxylating ferredoxin subunit
MMSRKIFLTLIGATMASFTSRSAMAVSGPSLKPTRLGQTIIWRGKKYTAIKSKGKLIWNKGVVVPSPKATKSSTPTPTPTPTAYPSPFYAELDLASSEQVLEGDTYLFFSSNPISIGKGFFISRQNGVLTAFDRICTHRGCRVNIGIPQLICSCHLSMFNRFTGAPEGGPATEPLRTYEVKEVEGRIIVTDINVP